LWAIRFACTAVRRLGSYARGFLLEAPQEHGHDRRARRIGLTARAERIAAALAVLTAGAVHLWLYGHDGYSSIHVIGPLFLLNGIAAALIGGGLLFSGALLVVLAGIGYALTTLVAFVVSATNGLFGWKEVWSGTPQAVAGFTELAAVLLLLPALARAVRLPSRGRGVVR
jgi:hypothetical protein